MYFGGAKAPGASNDDVAVFGVPLEHGSWANAEFLAHFRWNGDLSLRGDFGFSNGHGLHYRGNAYAVKTAESPWKSGASYDYRTFCQKSPSE